MIRNLLGSWLFAAFLVVVAVATWRVLDASRPALAPTTVTTVVVPVPARAPAPPPVVHTCGAGGAAPWSDDAVPALTRLQLGSVPYSDVVLDGRPVGRTPLLDDDAVAVRAGAHVLMFRDPVGGRLYLWRVVVGDGDDNKLVVGLAAHRATTFGAVSAVSGGESTVIVDDVAQARYETAVNALRDHDTKRGCAILDALAREAMPQSRWRQKATHLLDRRCR